MKALIETISSVVIKREIDLADSPMKILQDFYQEDASAAAQIFCNQTAIDQLMAGNVDETKSSFDLVGLDNEMLRTDWKTPLCDQPSIKEEIARIEGEGQTPKFVVSVSNIVAAGREGGVR